MRPTPTPRADGRSTKHLLADNLYLKAACASSLVTPCVRYLCSGITGLSIIEGTVGVAFAV